MTKDEAIAAGYPLYDTGRPCKNGHSAPRYVSCGVCVECLRASRNERTRARNTAMAVRTAGAGLFAYKLHPEDFAAALSFCQALDLQRGRTPQTTPALALPAQPGGGPLVLPAVIAAARAQYDYPPEVLAQHQAARGGKAR